MCICVYAVNTAMASSIKRICSPVYVCVHVEKVYLTNLSIVGRIKENKKLTLLTYMGMCVCIYVRDRKNGPFIFLSWHMRFLWSLVKKCRIPVVGKRMSHASSLYVLCILASLCLVVECLS